jgi:putative SOS response-associated peptidase YedK
MERFVLQTTANEIESIFGVIPKSISMMENTFNAAPGYLLPVIFSENGLKKIESCIWNPDNPTALLDEFIHKTNASSQLIKSSCIVPISGFYLWKQTVKDPLPFFVRIHSQPILGIPGYFSITEGSRKKFTVFTRSANVLLKPLDDLMPCILEPNEFDLWLNQQADTIAGNGFVANEMITDMTVFRVPDLVNGLSNNGPELIQPIPKVRDED